MYSCKASRLHLILFMHGMPDLMQKRLFRTPHRRQRRAVASLCLILGNLPSILSHRFLRQSLPVTRVFRFRFPDCRHRGFCSSVVAEVVLFGDRLGSNASREGASRYFGRVGDVSSGVQRRRSYTASCGRFLVSQRFVITRVLCRLTHRRPGCWS